MFAHKDAAYFKPMVLIHTIFKNVFPSIAQTPNIYKP